MKRKVILFLFFVIQFIPSFASSKLTTNSTNIIAIDRKSLSILYEKNAYNSVPMASTTKIMTCIIALEYSNMEDFVIISKKASLINGSTLGLKVNQKIKMGDLLYGLMLRSGNDCAIAIAEHVSGSIENFSVLMNKKAEELNLNSTHFVTPHGLDNPDHYTSAYDLALLTNYALKNEEFKKIVSTKQCTIYVDNRPRTIQNTNELLGVLDGVYGVKTGFTFEAGRCLVSACKRNNLDIIVVVLGANTKNIRTTDSKNIINYIFNNFEYVNLKDTLESNFKKIIKQYSSRIIVEKTSEIPELYLETKSNYDFPFLKNELPNLNFRMNLLSRFSPKIVPGSIVGTIYIFNNDKLIFSTNILLKNKLSEHSWKYYFKKCLVSVF